MKDLRNRVQLIGHLGMDPELIKFDGGRMLAKFSLATSQSYLNNKGDKVQDTQWHNIVAWGKLAETAEKYLKKGKEIALDGKLIYRNYEATDGTKKYITEIVLNDFTILSKKEATKEKAEGMA